MNTKQNTILFTILIIGVIFLFIINISLGSVSIPIKEVFNSITGGNSTKETWQYIIIDYRLPKAITSIIV